MLHCCWSLLSVCLHVVVVAINWLPWRGVHCGGCRTWRRVHGSIITGPVLQLLLLLLANGRCWPCPISCHSRALSIVPFNGSISARRPHGTALLGVTRALAVSGLLHGTNVQTDRRLMKSPPSVSCCCCCWDVRTIWCLVHWCVCVNYIHIGSSFVLY